MIERLSTRTSANGYAYQAEIDHDARTIKYGYFIFSRVFFYSLTVGKRELTEYIDRLICANYKRI